MPSPHPVPSVFLGYSYRDELWKDRLKAHLGALEPERLLDVWEDGRIEGGAEWFEEVQEALARAGVAVLLVSRPFLSSKLVRGAEVPRLLQRRHAEGMPVMPVIVRPCAWTRVPWLAPMQPRPRDGRALATLPGKRCDQELAGIAEEVLGLLRDAPRDRAPRRPADDFLDRVEAACRLREPKAEVRRFPGIGDAGGYLRVVRRAGSFRDAYPVGAVEHDLSRQSFQAFLDEIDAPYRKPDPGLLSVLVYGGAPAPAALVHEAATRRVRLVRFDEYQGLSSAR